MENDQDLDLIERDLLKRKARLEKLVQLRREVSELELTVFYGNGNLKRSAEIVSEIVCGHHNLPASSVWGRCREQRLVLPRHTVFYLLRTVCGCSTVAMGQVFQVDHSSVSHACKKMIDLIQTNPKFGVDIARLEFECKAALEKGQVPEGEKRFEISNFKPDQKLPAEAGVPAKGASVPL